MFHVEQNLYNEIVLQLLREPVHLRGLADRLHVNHMTIGRKLAVLQDDNVVDFTMEGKNKVYFLKKTIESRNIAIASELYKQSRAVARYPLLRGVLHAILGTAEVRFALIFGSYAKSTAHEGSDIDIFIESLNRDVKKELERQNRLLSVKIGAFDIENPLIREIMDYHIIIRGVEDYFEKTQFFA